MLVIPSVDILDGECVRLTKGMKNRREIVAESPIKAALKWIDEGAKIIHVIDLNGAIEGEMKNKGIILDIVKLGATVEVGGGIRNFEIAKELLENGIERIIIGTRYELINEISKTFGKERVVGAVETKDNRVMVKGWLSEMNLSIRELIRRMERNGAGRLLYTSVNVDGTLRGPNIKGIKEMVKMSRIPVIASGGISCLEDIKGVKETGVEAVVVGKALYLNKFTLKQAMEAAE